MMCVSVVEHSCHLLAQYEIKGKKCFAGNVAYLLCKGRILVFHTQLSRLWTSSSQFYAEDVEERPVVS